MSYKSKIERIIELRDEINKLKKVTCTCSGFVIKYEQGCQCNRSTNIKKTQKELDEFITKL